MAWVKLIRAILFLRISTFSMQEISSQTFTPQLSDNSNIDFAIWALTQFGIHYPPFNCHTLQDNPHLNSNQWYQWLLKIIRQFDGRLKFEDTERNSNADIARYKELLSTVGNINFPDSAWDKLRSDSRQFDLESLEYGRISYQQALIDWDITESEVTKYFIPPHELFLGQPETVQLLGQLWEQFGETRCRIAETVSYKYITNRINCTSPRDNIIIYFVNYSKLVSMYVHPNTILISLTDEFKDVDHFNHYVQSSIDNVLAVS